MPRAEHMSSENWGGDRGNTTGGSSGGMSVDVILDNLARKLRKKHPGFLRIPISREMVTLVQSTLLNGPATTDHRG